MATRPPILLKKADVYKRQVLNRAMNLAYYAHLGSPDLYWEEFENKSKLQGGEITDWAHRLIREENSSVLYYQAISS